MPRPAATAGRRRLANAGRGAPSRLWLRDWREGLNCTRIVQRQAPEGIESHAAPAQLIRAIPNEPQLRGSRGVGASWSRRLLVAHGPPRRLLAAHEAHPLHDIALHQPSVLPIIP